MDLKFIYLALHIIAENLVWLAHCIAKIRMATFVPGWQETYIIKTNKFVCIICADNFLIYSSVYMCNVSNMCAL